MSVTVHRAASVYTPRFTVLVNPPDPAQAARIRAAGGGARALEWVLDGMVTGDPSQQGQTSASFIDMLVQQGISEETARDLAQQAVDRGEINDPDSSGSLTLPDDLRNEAQEEALAIANAVAGGRTRIEDMVQSTTPPLRTLYESSYSAAIGNVSLEGVELLPRFPVATIAFGFTRGDARPGQSRLVAFRHQGHLRAFAQRSLTEALLFRLDPLAVDAWLRRSGLLSGRPPTSSREARALILERAIVPAPIEEHPQDIGEAVLTLIHSFAHRAIRRLGAFAGIERDSLAEYLLPRHLGFIVYAAARGDFVLGGLQAVFETSLHKYLDDMLYGESRCPLDPGCRTGGGACMACLHLGEPSCRWFNRFLDRDALFGNDGYLR